MIIDRVWLFMNFPNGIFRFKIKQKLFDFKLYACRVPEIFNIREKSKNSAFLWLLSNSKAEINISRIDNAQANQEKLGTPP